MLIIFDLDDTLIETSAYITPVKLGKALVAIIAAGCPIDDFDEALKKLLAMNERALSAKEALLQFVRSENIDESFFYLALHEVYQVLSEDVPVVPVEGAMELLELLKEKNTLAIVSNGKFDQQMFKLKKAGIDSAFFYKITLLDGGSKKNSYLEVINELGLLPKDVLVIGDRIQVDLSPAKEIGCNTVHMKKGRGSQVQGNQEDADFSITDLCQLHEILKGITINRGYNG